MPTGGGGGGSTTTVQKSDPWAGQQSYLTDIFKQAQTLSSNPIQQYQGQTYASMSPETKLALDWQTQRATAGSPVVASAQNELTRTLNGDYLNAGNPYMVNAFNAGMKEIQPQIDSAFASAGRRGSGLHTEQLSKAMADTYGKLAYDNYNTERGNMQKAMLFAPDMANQDYSDIARLAEVGSARESDSQLAINDAIQKMQTQQMEPWQRLSLYNDLVQGNYGGTSTATGTGARSSVGGGLLGTAASGIGLLSGLSDLGLFSKGGFLASMFSDAALKENIKRIGKENGFPVYEFSYIWNKNKRYIGVMAQDVEEIMPDAVIDYKGTKMVDYNKIGVKFREAA